MFSDEKYTYALRKIQSVEPAIYFPIPNGRYVVTAGMRPLTTDYGNGPADGLAFQLDREFPETFRQKLQARRERLEKYYGEHKLDPQVREIAVAWIVERLAQEHPEYFQLERDGERLALKCALTKEELDFEYGELIESEGGEPEPLYASALDALACQVQEDIAIVQSTGGQDHVAALHCCNPSHWAAESKIGKSFADVHVPVANFQQLSANATHLIQTMLKKGPFVRFTWGLSTNERLNHHPEPAPDVSPEEWFGPPYTQITSASQLFMRIERQFVQGFPEHGAFIFLVRTYYRNAVELSNAERADLRSAVETMHPDSLKYKGLAEGQAQILAALA
ncbi:DUF3445 domain-containing protein [Candidatus Sumerlaeota bacterium]|nr:DUF3445 domain-containing protein [Candidatus Sumerlaeota bacterium]